MSSLLYAEKLIIIILGLETVIKYPLSSSYD